MPLKPKQEKFHNFLMQTCQLLFGPDMSHNKEYFIAYYETQLGQTIRVTYWKDTDFYAF